MTAAAAAAPWIAPDLAAALALLSDTQVVAATVYGEARSEPLEGQAGVAWAIRRRVETDLGSDQKPDWWGEGYRDVCLKPWQFSCWNAAGGVRNHERVRDLVAQMAHKIQLTDPKVKQCLYIATGVMRDMIADPTKGANHYHTVAIPKRPAWADRRVPLVQIGHHVFYDVR